MYVALLKVRLLARAARRKLNLDCEGSTFPSKKYPTRRDEPKLKILSDFEGKSNSLERQGGLTLDVCSWAETVGLLKAK